jgi:hypothetical protein
LNNFGGLTVFNRGSRWQKESKERKGKIMVTPMLAEVSGSIQVGLAGLGSAIGVGLVGMKASEAVGRNPGAFGKIITWPCSAWLCPKPSCSTRSSWEVH